MKVLAGPGALLRVSIYAALAAVLASLTIAAVPRLRWRAQVLLLKVTGRIPDIELRQLVGYMIPGPQQKWVQPLIETRNPYAVILNTRTTAEDIRAGAVLFRAKCAGCHAPDGSGGAGGPALVGRKFTHGESDWALYRTILYGVPSTAMAAHPLPDADMWQLIAFLGSLNVAGKPAEAGQSQPGIATAVNLPFAELSPLREASADWLTYSGSYSSWRHTALTQVDRRNVGQMALRWIHQFTGEPGELGIEVSPLVRNGVMFLTGPPNLVLALNAATGEPYWTYENKLPGAHSFELGTVPNRGVALLDDKVFFGTSDARVVGLSAATGQRLWETRIADAATYGISGAPIAYKDLVVTGALTIGGGQGFVVALDAKTGKERWRFVVIPRPGQPGSDTWSGDSARNGGGPTWLTGSYDPDRDLLVWTTGNPKPDYDDAARKGDNLYTNSAVALRGTTGELIWHFQFTPADNHDWDSNQIPVLVDRTDAQGVQRYVLVANRNGFYYALDRESGKFMSGTPFVKQTWTAGLDARGKPTPPAIPQQTQEGRLTYPGNVGGTNWWSPSYDPDLDLMFVPVLEQGMVYFTSTASTPRAMGGQSFYTGVRALGATTGKIIWESLRKPRREYNKVGGVLSTKTGIVFGGDLSTFFALDARDGKQLWSVETGGNINASPVSYSANGEQFVIIAAGRDLLAFALPPSAAHVSQSSTGNKPQ